MLVQCRQIVYDTGPAKTCHLPNTVLLLLQRLQRWLGIETTLGDCPVFACTAMRMTLDSSRRQKSYYRKPGLFCHPRGYFATPSGN